MSNIVDFDSEKKKKQTSYQVLEDLRKDLDDNQVSELVIIWAKKNKNGQRDYFSYWIGQESTIFILGCVERMKHIIQKYIDDYDPET